MMIDKQTTEPEDLAELAALANTYEGSWKDTELAQDIKMSLWKTYDPNDNLIYPTVDDWGNLLTKTIESNSYNSLTKDEILSILFGLIHHTRIVSGSWESMFERGVAQKLLSSLVSVNTEALG